MLSAKQFYNRFVSTEKEFAREIRYICGYTPKEIFLYRLAMTHSSYIQRNKSERNVARECNERLEFLGDSVLDAVIAEYLFKIYPLKDEGFLTEMRSKIVNRKSLNSICKKLRIDKLILHKQNGPANESMYGDALEAFIGALYVDLGYRHAKRFVYKRIINPHIHLLSVEQQVISYKNKLIEYVQKSKMGLLEFEVIDEKGEGRKKRFKVRAIASGQELGTGEGKNKKTAEQNASLDALVKLNELE